MGFGEVIGPRERLTRHWHAGVKFAGRGARARARARARAHVWQWIHDCTRAKSPQVTASFVPFAPLPLRRSLSLPLSATLCPFRCPRSLISRTLFLPFRRFFPFLAFQTMAYRAPGASPRYRSLVPIYVTYNFFSDVSRNWAEPNLTGSWFKLIFNVIF